MRPKGVGGAKLDSWWIGPCKVTARKGASSYEIVMKGHHFKDVHVDQLKEYEPDWVTGEKGVKFNYKHGFLPGLAKESPGWVDTIKAHRTSPTGVVEFLTHWKGTPSSEDVWEPQYSKALQGSLIWRNYCESKGMFDLEEDHGDSESEDSDLQSETEL